jgi:hydrogenase nickel incorporation protein HypA/HybF
MHELSLCESITELVVEAAKREGVARISRVVLALGAAASVEVESLRFCFPVTCEGTPAEGAELAIEIIPLQARCQACGAEFAPETLISPCPQCGNHARTIIAGREMRVVSFEGT